MSNSNDPDSEMERLIREMKAKLTTDNSGSNPPSPYSTSALDIAEFILELEMSSLIFARESMHHVNMSTISSESIDLLETIALRTSRYIRTRLGFPKNTNEST